MRFPAGRRLRRFCREHATFLGWSAALLSVLALLLALGPVPRFAGAGLPERAEAAPQEPLGEARAVATTPPADDAAEPVAPRAPEVDWQTPGWRRQAATLLGKAGDMDEALALLRHSAATRELAEVVGQATYGAAVRRLRAAWATERRHLGKVWAAAAADERYAWYSAGSRARYEQAVRTFAVDEPALRELYPHLPLSLQYALRSNLLAGIRAEASAATLDRLVLEQQLPPNDLAARLQQRPPNAIPFAEHLAATNAAIARRHLHNLVAKWFLEMKNAVLAQRPSLEWLTAAYGEKLVRGVPGHSVLAPDPQLMAGMWEGIPEPARTLVARRLAGRLRARLQRELPPALREQNLWLLPAADRIPKGATLTLIRKHPAWQRPLRRCDHRAALDALGEILADLYAQDFRLAVKIPLTSNVELERQYMRGGTPWERLADLLGTRFTRPPGLGQTRMVHNPDSQRKWAEVPPRVMARALRMVAKRSSERYRTSREMLARLYAINRAVLPDSAEPDEMLEPIGLE